MGDTNIFFYRLWRNFVNFLQNFKLNEIFFFVTFTPFKEVSENFLSFINWFLPKYFHEKNRLGNVYFMIVKISGKFLFVLFYVNQFVHIRFGNSSISLSFFLLEQQEKPSFIDLLRKRNKTEKTEKMSCLLCFTQYRYRRPNGRL